MNKIQFQKKNNKKTKHINYYLVVVKKKTRKKIGNYDQKTKLFRISLTDYINELKNGLYLTPSFKKNFQKATNNINKSRCIKIKFR